MSIPIPTHLIEAILLRVPAVDLVRCKVVCKVWRSLISSADFVAAHLERAKPDPQLLLVRNPSVGLLRRTVAEDPFSSFGCFSSGDLLFVGSVNGLICIAGKGYTPCQPLTPDDVWIINPVTGLSTKLPYSSSSNFYEWDYNVKFAFWCDGNVYKVAKLLSNCNGKSMLELWVSTSPDTWTVISTLEFDFHFHIYRRHACDVLVEGVAAYWICDHQIDDYECDYATVVVSLDLKTLALNMFIPQWYTTNNAYRWKTLNGDPNYLLFGGNLNGEFVLVALGSSDDGGRCYDVWTLVKNDDDSTGAQGWIKKFIIRLDSLPFHKCIGIVNDKLVLTNYEEMAVALFDPFTGMLEGVETLSQKFYMGSACGFVGSLVSINGFRFESHDLLRQSMGIKLPPPYSLYPSSKEEECWRMKSCSKKQRRQ